MGAPEGAPGRQSNPTAKAHNVKLTAERDASGRVADNLARQIVDDLVGLKFEGGKK